MLSPKCGSLTFIKLRLLGKGLIKIINFEITSTLIKLDGSRIPYLRQEGDIKLLHGLVVVP